MSMNFRYPVAAVALSLFASIWTVAAADEAPAASQGLGGTVIPGVCFLSQEAVLANAKVGQAASLKLQTLARDAQAPLESERSAIEAAARSFDARKTSLSAAELGRQQQALALRAQAYQAKVQQLSRQIDATRAKVVGQIATSGQPIVSQAYQAHRCSLLFARNAVLGGNLSGDLTAEVVAAMDAKLAPLDFTLDAAAPSAP